jgi:hypothetical protein
VNKLMKHSRSEHPKTIKEAKEELKDPAMRKMTSQKDKPAKKA